jgi:glycosyltransferase involved in cell wall biosynthesis
VSAVPEIVVEGETGLLVEPGDDAALADALTRLLDDGELRRRLGEAGRARARAEFSVERMTAQTVEVYRSALDP